MKRISCFLMCLLLVFILSGCTSKREIDLMQQNYDNLNENYSELKGNYDKLNAEYSELKEKYDKYTDIIENLESDNFELAVNLVEEKKFEKTKKEKGDIDKYLVTVEINNDNVSDYFDIEVFNTYNEFGEIEKDSYVIMVVSKAYDKGLVLYDGEISIGYTSKIVGTYIVDDDVEQFLGMNSYIQSGGFEIEPDKCEFNITRATGTVTFVKSEYVFSYDLKEGEKSSTKGTLDSHMLVVLYNGEKIDRFIKFGMKY